VVPGQVVQTLPRLVPAQLLCKTRHIVKLSALPDRKGTSPELSIST
jgi:hypothetical protein